MEIMFIDEHEPREMVELIAQSIKVQVSPLNRNGKADYLWVGVDGHTIHVERKQWGELVGNLGRVEEQLRVELENADETILLIEGAVDVTPWGVETYSRKRGTLSVQHQFGRSDKPIPQLYSALVSWLWQIDKCGVTVVQTASLSASAIALVAMYRNSQKAEHTTLRRYIKKKIEVPKLNPHVRILMGLPGIGEKLAIDMVKRWGTAWAALTQPVELWIEVLGKAAAYNLAKQLGRPEDEYGDGWR